MSTRPHLVAAFAIASCILGLFSQSADGAQYLGKFLGKLTELHHGVSGEVYAVDARTLHIKDFTYDGQGPAAYFFAGNSRAPGNSGFRIRDENGSPDVLRRYRKEGVTITLPEGKSLNNIKWFSVWCEEFEVNFGDVRIPKNFEYPRPQKMDGLNGVHGVSSDNIVIVDAQTLLVPNLSYDGEAPDAKFWVGRGAKPSPQGIRVPDENGKEIPLRRYDRKTVVLTLPGDLTVFDIGHFGIWCEAFTVDFGHVQIPQSLNVPPSLKMLGVSPQSKLNCEVLHDDLAYEVRWAVAGDSIVLQLVAKLENREYMSFGISGEEEKSAMIGGDVVVAWVDKDTLKGYAEDYFLEAKSQCSGPRGSCPDAKLAESTNNIRLLNAAMVNGYSIVTYQRPLRANDIYDKAILTNQTQAVIWAIGPLNQRDEVSFHSQYNKKSKFIDFGRAAKWNCPMPEGDQPPMRAAARPVQAAYTAEEPAAVQTEPVQPTQVTRTRGRNPEQQRRASTTATAAPLNLEYDNERSQSSTRQRTSERRGSTRPIATPAPVRNRKAWDIPPIQCNEPDDGVFYAQMGPTGGKQGYPAITGHVGWGISWYINGLLIPVINVVRGRTYTFVVEGGIDPEIPAKYHPFYVTDDPIGGYEYKTPEERKSIRIFAGARQTKDGNVHPTGVGRLCHWTHQGDSEADDFNSFGAYQRTLELKCDQGEPGVIQWTPDKNTPDTVYYQCFTHRYLGWKINVLDSCDIDGAASEVHEVVVAPDDLQGSPSILVETRVKPNTVADLTDKSYAAKDKDLLLMEQLDDTNVSVNLSTTEAPTIFLQKLPEVETKSVFQPLTQQKNNTHVPNSYQMLTMHKYKNKMPLGMPMSHMNKVVIRKQPQVMVLQPHYTRNHMVNVRRPIFIKKPYYRTYSKPMRGRPMVMKYDKPLVMPMPMPSLMKRQHTQTHKPITFAKQYNISVSSTTEALLPRFRSAEKKFEVMQTMRSAVNTGFDPSSVVIENGFKPIISKELQARMSDDESDEITSDIGVIDETRDAVREATSQAKAPTEYFEPVFIPSPTINTKKTRLDGGKKLHYNRRRSDSAADFSYAQESATHPHYLPPEIQSRALSSKDKPPSTVIAFDGKKVSGASLTSQPSTHPERSLYETRLANAAQIFRHPQTLPFKGEQPPLNAKVNPSAPQLHAAVRNAEPSFKQTITIRQLHSVDDDGDIDPIRPIGSERRRRAAHHTEEHTAQQQREAMMNNAPPHIPVMFNLICICALIHRVLE